MGCGGLPSVFIVDLPSLSMWRATNLDAGLCTCLAIEFSAEHSVRASRREPMRICLGTPLGLNAMGRIDIVTNCDNTLVSTVDRTK